MKASELMIGDLVQLTISHKPVIINGITYDSKIAKKHLIHFFFVNDGDARWNYSPESFEPFPITPEILEKNGWRYNDAPFVQGWEQYGLTIINNRITCGQNVSMKVEFVHELQHLLRLCGIEKEIVL